MIQPLIFSCVSVQFRRRFPLVRFHPGAHSLLGRGAPQTPGPTAEPATAPHSPAPSGAQRPPSHLSEPGPASHRPRRRGPPWRPTRGPGKCSWSLSLQGRRGWPVEVQSRQLGPHGGADPPPRAGRQVLPVSDSNACLPVGDDADCVSASLSPKHIWNCHKSSFNMINHLRSSNRQSWC